jgi:hypothetical protein
MAKQTILTGTAANDKTGDTLRAAFIKANANFTELYNLGVQGAQGTQGIQGITGSQGLTGIQGAEGPQGTQGTQGIEGSQGTQGIEGSQGTQGIEGSQGTQGIEGSQGTQGIEGSQGTQGTEGAQGTQGIEGSQGTTGLAFTIAKTYASVVALEADTAPTGIIAGQFALINTLDVQDPDNSKLYIWDGTNYIFVNDLSGTAGIQGIQGTQGTEGAQGIQGITGIQGALGSQGATGAGTQGTQGTQGRQGIQGSIGSGTQGTQGTQGRQGIQGISGQDGNTGAQGTQGRQGIQGSIGSGTQGAQGAIGTQGIQGIQGAQGIVGSNLSIQTLTVSGTASLNGLTQIQQADYPYTTKTSASGTVTHDCSVGQVFYHTSPSANFTVNLTNLGVSSGYITKVELYIVQGNTGRLPNALQVAGSSKTISWYNAVTPTPSSNSVDLVTFTLLLSGTTYTVFGKLERYDTVGGGGGG